MLNRLLVPSLLGLVAFFGFATQSDASGCGLFRGRGGCNSDCGAPCATAVPCMPVAQAPAPVPQYEDRKVIAYKTVTKEKVVDVTVCKPVYRDVKYTYTVCVPVTKQENRKVTVYNRVEKPVQYKYTVLVPKTVQKEVIQTTYQCVQEMVKETVPVCRLVRTNCVDECGRCYTRCDRVTVMEERTRCIVKRVPITQKVMVNQVICERQEMVGTRTVCELVPSVKDVVVNVCTIEQRQQEGVRKVCEMVQETVKQKVQYCETVPYETTVRVMIGGGACATSCDTGCGNGGGGGRRFGLFRRGGCCN